MIEPVAGSRRPRSRRSDTNAGSIGRLHYPLGYNDGILSRRDGLFAPAWNCVFSNFISYRQGVWKVVEVVAQAVLGSFLEAVIPMPVFEF